ncbi:MAG: AI-2E family transporter [Pseudomonadota bacterium]
MPPRAQASYTTGVIAVAATLWLMVQARSVLEPLVIALLIWFVLNALARFYAWRLHGNGIRPSLAIRTASAVTLMLVMTGIVIMTSNKAAQIQSNLPIYEENLRAMIASAENALGIPGGFGLDAVFERIDFGDLALALAGSTAGFIGASIIILVYVAFIFLEAGVFRNKLAAIAPDGERFDEVSATVDRIQHEIETYLGVKCVIGVAQALPTWLVLYVAGIDGAGFWAVLIFFFSFVPTVGTLFGIAFPALMTLVQFGDPLVFVVVTGLLVAIQLAGTNVLEPRLMGSSLNLSPLVILIAIFAGGSIWGITGALVAVPALSVAVIVFNRFESMRPVAILLSSDGQIR